MQFWPWTLFFFSVFHEFKILYNDERYSNSSLVFKTILLYKDCNYNSQARFSWYSHTISIESLRSTSWWKRRKKQLIKKYWDFHFVGKSCHYFFLPHAETFIISKIDWSMWKYLKLRLDWGLWVLIHTIKIYHKQ